MSDEPNPARVVADADVLAADLLCDGASRDAIDHLRAHSWTTLVASDPLLDDAETVVADLADDASRGVAIGGFNAAGSLGFLAGIVGGGYVADEYGYTEAFAVAGGAELALAAIALPALVKLRR